MNELAKIGFADMGDYVREDPDGTIRFTFADLTGDQTAALAQVKVEYFKGDSGEETARVRCVTIKLGDKHAALRALGRHLGIF